MEPTEDSDKQQPIQAATPGRRRGRVPHQPSTATPEPSLRMRRRRVAAAPTLLGVHGPGSPVVLQRLRAAGVDRNIDRVAGRSVLIFEVDLPSSVGATGLAYHFYGQARPVVMPKTVEGKCPSFKPVQYPMGAKPPAYLSR